MRVPDELRQGLNNFHTQRHQQASGQFLKDGSSKDLPVLLRKRAADEARGAQRKRALAE